MGYTDDRVELYVLENCIEDVIEILEYNKKELETLGNNSQGIAKEVWSTMQLLNSLLLQQLNEVPTNENKNYYLSLMETNRLILLLVRAFKMCKCENETLSLTNKSKNDTMENIK